jgi:hypothetical protein
MPHAADLGDTATVRIRRQNGNIETYTIPWIKTGTPLRVGPVPSPKLFAMRQPAEFKPADVDYMAELEQAVFSGVTQVEDLGVLGYGARNPVFINALALPSLRFTRRLGAAATDLIYSGTFQYEDLTIGYIRVPNYAPPSMVTWLQQLETEIAFMNANDGRTDPGRNAQHGRESLLRPGIGAEAGSVFFPGYRFRSAPLLDPRT